MTEKLLKPIEVAAILQVHRGTLDKWRRLGIGPPFVNLGEKAIRYEASAIDRWLAAKSEGAP